jgi:hypothetical protein
VTYIDAFWIEAPVTRGVVGDNTSDPTFEMAKQTRFVETTHDESGVTGS